MIGHYGRPPGTTVVAIIYYTAFALRSSVRVFLSLIVRNYEQINVLEIPNVA